MSWNNHVPAGDREHVLAALEQLGFPEGYTPTPAAEEQLAAAKAAAMMLIDSGSVGDSETHLAVSVSGHANPDHKPLRGWTSEMIHITVTEVYPEGYPKEANE